MSTQINMTHKEQEYLIDRLKRVQQKADVHAEAIINARYKNIFKQEDFDEYAIKLIADGKLIPLKGKQLSLAVSELLRNGGCSRRWLRCFKNGQKTKDTWEKTDAKRYKEIEGCRKISREVFKRIEEIIIMRKDSAEALRAIKNWEAKF